MPVPGIAGIKLTTCLTFDDILEKKAGTAASADTGNLEDADTYESDAFEIEGENDNEHPVDGARTDSSNKAVTFAATSESNDFTGVDASQVSAPTPPAPEKAGININEEGDSEEKNERDDGICR